jgi:hypothetical protein
MACFPIFDLVELCKFESDELLDGTKESHELSEIMSKYNSDKGFGLCKPFLDHNIYPPNRVCHNYTYFYHKLFEPYRNENIQLFEMGVGVPSCMGSWAGSLLGWKEFFPNSQIFSADIDTNWLYCDERITSYYVNQEDSVSINDMWKNVEDVTFDIIIDDGPHTYLSNILFYKKSIHKLKTNGIYVIEDITLDFIDTLYDEIVEHNEYKEMKYNIIKLIIPYPRKFKHIHANMMKMNNLIIIQKL